MTQFDYRFRPQTLAIIDEIFAPISAATKNLEEIMIKTPLYRGQKSSDNSIYTLALEIPRLDRDSISVDIEEDLKSTSRQVGYTSYRIVIKADQLSLINYLNHSQESIKKKFEQTCTLEGQNVDLNGSLGLAYSEGVLTIEIPLQKAVQSKKASLSARLGDIES